MGLLDPLEVTSLAATQNGHVKTESARTPAIAPTIWSICKERQADPREGFLPVAALGLEPTTSRTHTPVASLVTSGARAP